MISMLLLTAIAASAPIEARVTAVDLQRPVGGMRYNRISVELESAEGQPLRLCPSDLSVVTERRAGQGFAQVDRVPAYAMRLGGDRNHGGSCRDIMLAARRPQSVTFYVRGVPGRPFHNQEPHHRYTVVLNRGSSGSRALAGADKAAP